MTLCPLTAELEDAIWVRAWRSNGVAAQPLTGWLLHSMVLWADKRGLSDGIARVLGVSSKTLEAGLPRRSRKRKQLFDSLSTYFRHSLAESSPDCAARRVRAIERDARAFAEYPGLPPCTFFHHTLGIAGGDRLETLAVAVDSLSAAVLFGRISREVLPEALVRVAEERAAVPAQAVKPQYHLDPGLDALLLLMAQMDHDLTGALMADEEEINSLIGLLIDTSKGETRKRVQYRLLEIYYGLAVVASGRELPEWAPAIREVEDALLGGPPESGGQSWIVRWRNGTKVLRDRDVDSMVLNVLEATGKNLSWTMRRLYTAAQVWGRIEENGSDAVMMAGERYSQWWSALCNQGRVMTPWVDRYWLRLSTPHGGAASPKAWRSR